MSFLRIDGLHAFYGKSHVLNGVCLDVGEGEIVSLLGRNGVGRSTLVKAVMGQVHTQGSIKFKGEEISGLKPFQIAHKGVGYVPETRNVFPTLTVEQNLLLGVKGRRATKWTFDDMYDMFPRLRERAHVPAGVLSGGEQQMLTLCRSLMGDPELIMIDEPTEGLAPKIVDLIADYLKVMQQRGVSVLLIEQKQAVALEISQRVYIMGHGMIVFTGTPRELEERPDIQREWLEV